MAFASLFWMGDAWAREPVKPYDFTMTAPYLDSTATAEWVKDVAIFKKWLATQYNRPMSDVLNDIKDGIMSAFFEIIILITQLIVFVVLFGIFAPYVTAFIFLLVGLATYGHVAWSTVWSFAPALIPAIIISAMLPAAGKRDSDRKGGPIGGSHLAEAMILDKNYNPVAVRAARTIRDHFFRL
jgi:hypothetical protein